MDTLKEVLDRLDMFSVVSATRDTNYALIFHNGMKVSYKVKTLSRHQDEMTFQAVLRVTLDDGAPFTWGCSTEADNRLLVDWYRAHESRARELEYSHQDSKLEALNKILS
jgi:hypothetical protein